MCMEDQAMVTNERYSTPLDIHVIGLETLCLRGPFRVVMDTGRPTTADGKSEERRRSNGQLFQVFTSNQFHLDFILLLGKSCRGSQIAPPSNFIMTSSARSRRHGAAVSTA